MNLLNKLTIFLLLTGMSFVSRPILGQIASAENNLYTLYPPLNLQGSAVECNSYLHWQKPQMPDGTTPAGLMGYYIYRDGMMVTYISGADYLSYYDYNMEYGTYFYAVTANYDLTTYGVPGQFEESPQAGPVTVSLNCDVLFPFNETWDAGTFTFQSWQFVPAQGNWAMNTTQGDPAPSAVFNGSPAIQNYEMMMKSISLPGEPWVCAGMYVEFDYKLTDITSGGTEKMNVEFFADNAWVSILELKNEGSTGWIHQKIDISTVSGKRFRIGFKASGLNSANIGNWAVDNIRVYPQCIGPVNTSHSQYENLVHLFWQQPPCDSVQAVAGYNVYRTDHTGNPPFTKVNSTLLPGFEFVDTLAFPTASGIYKYLISDVQKNWLDNTVICEAMSDTVLVSYAFGIPGIENSGIRISPQPANDKLVVKSNTPVESWELFSIVGEKAIGMSAGKQIEFNIPVTALPSGIYFLRIKNGSGSFLSKVTVFH